jgi:hypothetical protein
MSGSSKHCRLGCSGGLYGAAGRAESSDRVRLHRGIGYGYEASMLRAVLCRVLQLPGPPRVWFFAGGNCPFCCLGVFCLQGSGGSRSPCLLLGRSVSGGCVQVRLVPGACFCSLAAAASGKQEPVSLPTCTYVGSKAPGVVLGSILCC